MKDFLGNQLNIGDIIVTRQFDQLVAARIIAFTPQKVRIVFVGGDYWQNRITNYENVVLVPSHYGQHIPTSCTRIPAADLKIHDTVITDGKIHTIQEVQNNDGLLSLFMDSGAIYFYRSNWKMDVVDK